jgi:hypothetical protein
MLDNDKRFQRKIERLRREHKVLSHYNHDLLNQLTLIAEGRRANRPELALSIERYVAGYRQHMDYEAREIFPHAKGILSRADLAKLSAKTRHINDPLFGGRVQYQYRRLGRNLRTRAEVASQAIIARELSGIESVIKNLSTLVATAGELRSAADRHTREAWREQLDSVRIHSRPGKGPSMLSLPLALFNNHRRRLRDSFSEMREILGGARKDQITATRDADGAKPRPRRRVARS